MRIPLLVGSLQFVLWRTSEISSGVQVLYWRPLEYAYFFLKRKFNLHAVYTSHSFLFLCFVFSPFRKHMESCCHIFFNVQLAIPFVTSASLHPLKLATASENKAWIGNPDLLLLKHFKSVHLLSFIHDKPYQLQSMQSQWML